MALAWWQSRLLASHHHLHLFDAALPTLCSSSLQAAMQRACLVMQDEKLLSSVPGTCCTLALFIVIPQKFSCMDALLAWRYRCMRAQNCIHLNAFFIGSSIIVCAAASAEQCSFELYIMHCRLFQVDCDGTAVLCCQSLVMQPSTRASQLMRTMTPVMMKTS